MWYISFGGIKHLPKLYTYMYMYIECENIVQRSRCNVSGGRDDVMYFSRRSYAYQWTYDASGANLFSNGEHPPARPLSLSLSPGIAQGWLEYTLRFSVSYIYTHTHIIGLKKIVSLIIFAIDFDVHLFIRSKTTMSRLTISIIPFLWSFKYKFLFLLLLHSISFHYPRSSLPISSEFSSQTESAKEKTS